MPIVQVSILKGRGAEARARFARAVTDAAVATLDVKPEQVRVLVTEIEPQDWFTGGVAKQPPQAGLR